MKEPQRTFRALKDPNRYSLPEDNVADALRDTFDPKLRGQSNRYQGHEERMKGHAERVKEILSKFPSKIVK